MATFTYTVTVECETADQAETVMGERLGPDEDYGFDYSLNFESARPPATQSQASERPPTVVIGIGGGLVQGASSTSPVEVIVLDYDTDGTADGDGVGVVIDDKGAHHECFSNAFDADIDPAYVGAIRESVFAKVYEVTAAGFDGEDDSTDDRVLWVAAENEQQVRDAIADTGAKFCGAVDDEKAMADVDFTLPRETMQLGSALLEFASAERNKNR